MLYHLLLVCPLPFAASSPTKNLNHAYQSSHSKSQESTPYPLSRQATDTESEAKSRASTVYDISSNPVSLRNDNGRPQMVDNIAPALAVNCPLQALNYHHCPRDFRYSLFPHSILNPRSSIQPTPQPVGVGDSNAIAGQKDLDIPTVSIKQPPPCPLQNCSVPGAKSCGRGATCRKGYCACRLGRKDQVTGLRVWTWPEVMNVYVNPGVPCEIPFDTLFCGEVSRARGCVGLQSLESGNMNDMWSSVVSVQEENSTSASISQEIIIGKQPSTSQAIIAAFTSPSQDLSLSTAANVPMRSLVSQVCFILPQSTRGRVRPTRSATCDDNSLPIVPGGMGAIHVPGQPGDDTRAGIARPRIRSDLSVELISRTVEYRTVG